jgi:hypothetical protein
VVPSWLLALHFSIFPRSVLVVSSPRDSSVALTTKHIWTGEHQALLSLDPVLQRSDKYRELLSILGMSKSSLPSTIRAWQYNSTSGGLEKNLVLNVQAPVPIPGPSQHLVRIIAVALNPVSAEQAKLAG